MALSGARGKKQIRQLIAARGMLEPGKTGFDPFDKGREHFFFSQPLAVGHDADSAFWAAMNARSSMVDKKLGTGYAGGLTRSMVFALWPFEITVECCGSAADKRSPVSCQQKVGCCAKCYGELPGGKLPAIGFPAGLIAAQSIGERGTQLSMQSFHAGASGIDIHTVRDLLRTSANFQELEQSGQFVTFMQKADAYENILDRHFQILWRVIHDSEQKSLPSAIAGQDALTVLANRHRASSLASAVLQGARSSRNGPIAKTLLGGFRSEEQPQTPD
jgi:DNA-directed RNA polymerase beta' subunit